MAGETIPRNHKKKIGAIKDKVTRARLFTLENNFSGARIDPSKAWEALYRYDFARLTQVGDKWSVYVHSNYWYDLHAD